jgi:hypothetical protein
MWLCTAVERMQRSRHRPMFVLIIEPRSSASLPLHSAAGETLAKWGCRPDHDTTVKTINRLLLMGQMGQLSVEITTCIGLKCRNSDAAAYPPDFSAAGRVSFTGSTFPVGGSNRPHSQDEPSQSPLGSATHSWGTVGLGLKLSEATVANTKGGCITSHYETKFSSGPVNRLVLLWCFFPF